MSSRVVSLAERRAEREGWVTTRVEFGVWDNGNGTAHLRMTSGDVMKGNVEVNEAHLNEETLAALHAKVGAALASMRKARGASEPVSRRLSLVESLDLEGA